MSDKEYNVTNPLHGGKVRRLTQEEHQLIIDLCFRSKDHDDKHTPFFDMIINLVLGLSTVEDIKTQLEDFRYVVR